MTKGTAVSLSRDCGCGRGTWPAERERGRGGRPGVDILTGVGPFERDTRQTAGDGSLTRGQRRAGTVPGSLVRSAVGCRVRAAPQSPGERSRVVVSTSLQVNAKQALEFKKKYPPTPLDGWRSKSRHACRRRSSARAAWTTVALHELNTHSCERPSRPRRTLRTCLGTARARGSETLLLQVPAGVPGAGVTRWSASALAPPTPSLSSASSPRHLSKTISENVRVKNGPGHSRAGASRNGVNHATSRRSGATRGRPRSVPPQPRLSP